MSEEESWRICADAIGLPHADGLCGIGGIRDHVTVYLRDKIVALAKDRDELLGRLAAMGMWSAPDAGCHLSHEETAERYRFLRGMWAGLNNDWNRQRRELIDLRLQLEEARRDTRRLSNLERATKSEIDTIFFRAERGGLRAAIDAAMGDE